MTTIQLSLPINSRPWTSCMHSRQGLYPTVSIVSSKEKVPETLISQRFQNFIRIGVTRFELAASTSLTWRATSCATPRSLYLASVSQQTQALLYKSADGKARGIFSLFCKHSDQYSDQRSDPLGLAKVASADHTSRICFFRLLRMHFTAPHASLS